MEWPNSASMHYHAWTHVVQPAGPRGLNRVTGTAHHFIEAVCDFQQHSLLHLLQVLENPENAPKIECIYNGAGVLLMDL